MLWQADAALVARDPALPGLATLLDPAALTAQVNTALAVTPDATGVCVGKMEPYYVRYKAGTNGLVAYQVQTARGPLYLHGVALPFGEEAKALKMVERAQPSIVGPGCLYLADLALLVTFFPNDRRLKSVAHLADEENGQRLWPRLAPAQPALAAATLTPLRYKPERRYVARLRHRDGAPDAPEFLLRLYAEEAYADALTNQRAFHCTERVRIARLVGKSERRGALLLEWLPGTPLDELLLQPRETTAVALSAAGQALAALHAQRPALSQQYTPSAECQALAAAGAALADLLPAAAHRVQLLQERLRLLLTHAPTARCTIHGDFSADQVLWLDVPALGAQCAAGQAPVALLDFDRAGVGAAAADLGAFAAHLHQLELRGLLTAAQRRASMAQLLAGYAACADAVPDADEIGAQSAVRLLRLAPDAFRQRWSAAWPAYTAAVIARVEQLLVQCGGSKPVVL
jgi:Ser/Thr protein kinase RdoA (MazF antagonist)